MFRGGVVGVAKMKWNDKDTKNDYSNINKGHM